MSNKVRLIRIFVASPGDVQKEREQLSRVVGELNLTIAAIAPEKSILLELVKWETHVAPGLGKDPQEVVDRQIGTYDIFVGILWKRMGTPTSNAGSGTEKEFQKAYKLWQNDNEFPVLFYFCQHSFPPPQTIEEVRQLGKVVNFRKNLTKKGLISEYPDHDSFADTIRPHLILAICKRYLINKSSNINSLNDADTIKKYSSPGFNQMLELAKDYEYVRSSMVSGDERTHELEAIFSKMRALALSTLDFLNILVKSDSSGQRLAAIAILQVQAKAKYLEWLAERLRTENEAPFIGYQAALALLSAVRTLYRTKEKELSSAIESAKQGFNKNKANDRSAILTQAQHELQTLVSKKKVLLCYDLSDIAYVHLLRAWDINLDFSFELPNKSFLNALDNSKLHFISEKLIENINQAEFVLVIIGEGTSRNAYVNSELEFIKSRKLPLKISAIRLDKSFLVPEFLIFNEVAIIDGFTNNNVAVALKRAKYINHI